MLATSKMVLSHFTVNIFKMRHYVKFEPKLKDDKPNSPVFTPLDSKYLQARLSLAN